MTLEPPPRLAKDAAHMKLTPLLTLLCLAVVGTACAPGIMVTRQVPPRIDLGPANTKVFVMADGEPWAAEHVRARLENRIITSGSYALVGHCGFQACGPTQFVIHATVVEALHNTEEATKANPSPDTIVKTWVKVQVTRADGVVVSDREYRDTERGNLKTTTVRALMTNSLQDVVNNIAYDFSSHKVNDTIEFDDDEVLKPGVKWATDGNLEAAQANWTQLLTANPNLAGALYNLGVLAEVRGETDQARDFYRRAAALSGKSLHQNAEAAMNARLNDSARVDARGG
jgi:hypothetical protein